jgi:hypothetical protein
LPAPTSSSAGLRLAARGRRRLLTTDAIALGHFDDHPPRVDPGALERREERRRRAVDLPEAARRQSRPRRWRRLRSSARSPRCSRCRPTSVSTAGWPSISPRWTRRAARAGHRGVASDRSEAAYPPVRTLTTRSDWPPTPRCGCWLRDACPAPHAGGSASAGSRRAPIGGPRPVRVPAGGRTWPARSARAVARAPRTSARCPRSARR